MKNRTKEHHKYANRLDIQREKIVSRSVNTKPL